MTHSFFAVSAPGVEPYTLQEVALLFAHNSLATPKAVEGGVEFNGEIRDLYLANLHLRTASRVLLRLGEFSALSFQELRRKAARLEWSEFLVPGQTLTFHVTCKKSKLYHSDAVTERVAGAVEDALGAPSPIEKYHEEAESTQPQLVVVRIHNDQVNISLDSSGPLLHRRGYRLASAKAPLRETLAAAMLSASGWDSSSPLVDPFCGSGTIPIEAAMKMCNIAPGLTHPFAFMQWTHFREDRFQSLLDTTAKTVISPQAALQGSDRDAGAIQASLENAGRVGVGKFIQFTCQAISNLQPNTSPGWIITNPPYGVRVSPDHDLRNLYARFGDILREQYHGWHFGILCSDEALLRQLRLPYHLLANFTNGGIPVHFIGGEIK